MKSGNLIFLEPSGPLQACNGTALLCMENIFGELQAYNSLGEGRKKNNTREMESNLDKPSDGRSRKENEDIDITRMPNAEDTTPKTVTGHPVLVKEDDT